VTSRPLVLVVEDDPDNLESLLDLLSDEGYDARGARNGREARQRLTEVQPTLMIVDYLLPDTDGITLVRELNAESKGAPVPVVFLTAASDPIDSAGAPIVKKPVALPDLLELLIRYCGPAPSPA
jgi:two-component system sensor histidine kinase/response regulator